jgi:hypothetical protein
MNAQATAMETETIAPGWLKAIPLENYSSLHELSLGELVGWNFSWPQKHFFVQFSFNLHTPLHMRPEAYLVFDTRDADKPPVEKGCCYSIDHLTRWGIDINPFATMEDFIASRMRWNKCNYAKSGKVFNEYGCIVTFTEGDWSDDVDTFYPLYCNVAKRHGEKLYDLHFFREAAKRSDYKLLCVWLDKKMIAGFLIQEELPTLHAIICGMDYEHTSKCYAYSWMHYEFIRYAIEAKKYTHVNVGPTADEFKKMIGFEAIPCRMDIYSKGVVTRNLLKLASRIVTATITPEAKLKFGLRWGNKK